MRTVTFSDPELQERLSDHFVLAWENTEGKNGSGNSYSTAPGEELPYRPRMVSGYNNSQVILLDPDGTVLNVYPGYWSPKYFKKAIQANWMFYRNVWTSDRYSAEKKKSILRTFYRQEARLLYNYKVGIPPGLRKHFTGADDPDQTTSLVSIKKVAGGGKSGSQKLRNHKKVAKMKMRLTSKKYFLKSWDHFDTVQFVGIPSGFSKFYGIEPEEKTSSEGDFDQPNYRTTKKESQKDKQETFDH